MGSDEWTALAAIATALSAVVIAWQAILTRQSLQYTRKSLQLSTHALKEAERARIDLGAPANIIVAWPENGLAFADLGPRRNQPMNDRIGVLGWGDTFQVPADEDRPLAIYTRVDIHNVGPAPAYVATTHPVTPLWDFEVGRDTPLPTGSRSLLLPANAHWQGWVITALATGEWVGRLRSSDPQPLTFDVEYIGSRSSDVRVIARCELTGGPVATTPGNDSTFRVTTEKSVLLNGHSLRADRGYRDAGRAWDEPQ